MEENSFEEDLSLLPQTIPDKQFITPRLTTKIMNNKIMIIELRLLFYTLGHAIIFFMSRYKICDIENSICFNNEIIYFMFLIATGISYWFLYQVLYLILTIKYRANKFIIFHIYMGLVFTFKLIYFHYIETNPNITFYVISIIVSGLTLIYSMRNKDLLNSYDTIILGDIIRKKN